MTDEYVPQWVDKIQVAARQVRVAIRLHFEECDPVALHTIVAAAHEVVDDLAGHKGSATRIGKSVRFAANFFKHADRDPAGRINIEPLGKLTQDLLFDTVSTLQRVAAQIPFEAKLYWAWFMCVNEPLFAGSGLAIEEIIRDNRHLVGMSFADIRQFLRFQQVLDTSEPLPHWALLGPGPLTSKALRELEEPPSVPPSKDGDADRPPS